MFLSQRSSRSYLSVLTSAILLISTLVIVFPSSSSAVSSNPTPDCSAGSTCTVIFTYTGDYYSWTVPSGVTSLTVDLRGARGGNGIYPSCTNGSAGGSGGLGGKVTGVLSVTSSSTIFFYVGGRGEDGITLKANGGFNGGGGAGYDNGSAVSGPCFPGTGGGASDIRTAEGTLSTRLIVAGGGGGAGGYTPGNGGAGGGLIAGNGLGLTWVDGNGKGGTQIAGGAQSTLCGNATAGTAGVGGKGAGCSHGGGGGGGGYFGGGGGIVESGGGGSSYANPSYVTSAVHTQGTQNGNGQISITYLNSPIPTTFSTSQSTPTNISTSSTITYSLILSQSVSDLATGDFQFGGTSTCNSPGLSGSGTTYSVTITNCTEGDVILQLKANSVTGTSTGPPSVSSANTIVIDRTAPTISSVAGPANATYKPTQALTFSLATSETVTVTGTPRLALTIGSTTRYANYASGSNTRTLLFTYTVASSSSDIDSDGIAVSTTLDLNSGTIVDLASNAMSPLTFSAPTLTSVLVAQPPGAPTIDAITSSSGQISIAFTAGITNGAAITNYEYSTNNGVNWTTRSPVATTSPITVSGLSNGTAYNVRLRAINSAGTSDSSTVVSATPTAVVVAGGSNISTSYGTAASSSQFTASGGTSPYTFTLSSTPTGVSISGGVVTASATTNAGTYTQNVIATDSGSQSGTKQIVITVGQVTPTITIALTGGATSAALGSAITITATVSQAGSVNFKIGGSTISWCSSVSSSGGSATCSWTPAALGGVVLTAVLTPTDSTNYANATTTDLNITVVNGVTTVSLSLAGGVTTVAKGQYIVITASVDQAGRISFTADGKRLAGCTNLSVSGASKTCRWKPAVRRQVNLSARLVPTNNAYSTTSASLSVMVISRTGKR